MNQVPHQMESTGSGAVLYMALELSARRWQLAFGRGLATPSRRRTIVAGDRRWRCSGRSRTRNGDSGYRQRRRCGVVMKPAATGSGCIACWSVKQ